MVNKIIVTQVGSRHRYLVPRLLEKNKKLYRLYTDSTKYSMLGKIASLLKRLGINWSTINRLCKRTPDIALDRIYSSDSIVLKRFLYRLFRKSEFDKMQLTFTGISSDSIKWGVGEGDCVYAMYFENIEFVRYAKEKGLKIVVDFYERPLTYQLLINEIQSTPEFSIFQNAIGQYELKHDIRMKYIEEILLLADKYTIPSKFVLKSLEEFKNFDSNKAYLLPYPSSIVSDEYRWKPRKHRLLFVGSDPINKGLLYCAKAATLLKQKYPDLDFRVAGSGFADVQNDRIFKDLNFIGFLNQEQLKDEFQTAEAFVFPTLFEGFAGVVIEAASCGCPVITTENSGVDIDVFPGIIIPEKNSNAIYESIVALLENPRYQKDLSKNIYEYSKSLHPDEYEKRLLALFEKI